MSPTSGPETENEEVETFDINAWCQDVGLTKKSAQLLTKEDINSKETLSLMSDDDIVCLGLTLGQRKLLCAAVHTLKDTQNQDTRPPAQSVARGTQSEAPTPDDSTIKDVRNITEALDQGKSFLELFNDMPGSRQAGDINTPPGTVFDPRTLLSLKATKTKALHITDFLPESVRKRRMSRQREMVLSTNGSTDDVLVLRTDHSHPYAGISLSEWGAANCRLMAALLDRQLLPAAETQYYLAYTLKIFEFVSKYEWESVLEFDYRYREIQAEHGIKWGIHAPDLELHVLERRQKQRPPLAHNKTRAPAVLTNLRHQSLDAV